MEKLVHWLLGFRPEHWLGIAQILITIAGMIWAPWRAVSLANKQFRSQKWWEAQHNAYKEILESLSVLATFHDTESDRLMRQYYAQASIEGSPVPDYVKVAIEAVHRAHGTGPYLISERTATALSKYVSVTTGDGPPWDYDEEKAAVAREALEIIKKEASLVRGAA